jgi:hypothetical protein
VPPGEPVEPKDPAGGESVESIGRRFPELDEAARHRAAARMAAGAEPHAAYAHESVMLHLVRVYN